jgi:L-ascorbate metabolism protein UlaG (beta-lactamase superfamily)
MTIVLSGVLLWEVFGYLKSSDFEFMRITKLGHCCLLIEEAGKRILTDPGSFTTPEAIMQCVDIDVVLITHEHGDHVHIETLEKILELSPNAEVITNSTVGALLDVQNIAYQVVEGSTKAVVDTIMLTAYDAAHATIDGDFGQVQNTGYFIAEKLFYPGDAYTNPGVPVPVLALPVSGPWAKVSDVLDYARAVRPRHAFPVHDGLLNEQGLVIVHRVVGARLQDSSIDFTPLRAGAVVDYKL